MSVEDRFYRPIGFVTILASLPMVEAGIQAVRGFSGHGLGVRLMLSEVSTAGALLLLIAGIVLCAKRPAGGAMTYWAAAISIAVTFIGTVIGLMGGHALLYGLGYPLAIVTLLRRATPTGGVPTVTQSPGPESSGNLDRHLRVAGM